MDFNEVVAGVTMQLPHLFGAKFKMIHGYPSGNEINLAMERGEVQGRCSIPWSTVKATRRSWIDGNNSLGKHADLPNVPLVMDLAETDEQRTIVKLHLRPPSDGPSLRGAAGGSQGSRQRSAQRLRGNDG
jgi:hypothetical protein